MTAPSFAPDDTVPWLDESAAPAHRPTLCLVDPHAPWAVGRSAGDTGQSLPGTLLAAHPPNGPMPTTRFRSTWLASSLEALKSRDLLGDYLTYLAPEHHEAVLANVPGTWLPIGVAHAHYAAVDALPLRPAHQFAMGREVCQHMHASALRVVVRLARRSSVDPWTVLERAPRLWARIWDGGSLAVSRIAPRESWLELAGFSCAGYPYVRQALRGVFHGLVELFCARAELREVGARARHDRVTYRLTWT